MQHPFKIMQHRNKTVTPSNSYMCNMKTKLHKINQREEYPYNNMNLDLNIATFKKFYCDTTVESNSGAPQWRASGVRAAGHGGDGSGGGRQVGVVVPLRRRRDVARGPVAVVAVTLGEELQPGQIYFMLPRRDVASSPHWRRGRRAHGQGQLRARHRGRCPAILPLLLPPSLSAAAPSSARLLASEERRRKEASRRESSDCCGWRPRHHGVLRDKTMPPPRSRKLETSGDEEK
ncbi:hypothetical protein C2845_PM13G18250 [Panicum miliaceum]|uniref:Uncharacterized protein n=1 Tax=Panicum miliaceum TaxID=4540 RepID=A0A3L6RJX9_PANMI|nr:hypothetical protein C2845_PM13G18250 [Panicum miliaceum]